MYGKDRVPAVVRAGEGQCKLQTGHTLGYLGKLLGQGIEERSVTLFDCQLGEVFCGFRPTIE